MIIIAIAIAISFTKVQRECDCLQISWSRSGLAVSAWRYAFCFDTQAKWRRSDSSLWSNSMLLKCFARAISSKRLWMPLWHSRQTQMPALSVRLSTYLRKYVRRWTLRGIKWWKVKSTTRLHKMQLCGVSKFFRIRHASDNSKERCNMRWERDIKVQQLRNYSPISPTVCRLPRNMRIRHESIFDPHNWAGRFFRHDT